MHSVLNSPITVSMRAVVSVGHGPDRGTDALEVEVLGEGDGRVLPTSQGAAPLWHGSPTTSPDPGEMGTAMGTVTEATNPAPEARNPLRRNESRYLRQGVPKSAPIQMGTAMGTVDVTAPDRNRDSRCSATTFEWVAGGSNPEPYGLRGRRGPLAL
jgi:hypothetical protein